MVAKLSGLSSPSYTLTHCRLNELPHTIYWKILTSILGMSGYVILIFLKKKIVELFANSRDPD